FIHRLRCRELHLGDGLGLVLPRQPTRSREDYGSRDRYFACLRRREGGAVGTVAAAHPAHAAGDPGVLLLWLDAVAFSDLDSPILPAQLPHGPQTLRGFCLGSVLRRRAR